ncbi:MAG: MCE family protein [Acidobacteria bacterium]|nr:MCE family protein [Acidobacteriota bacterium]
MSNEQTSRTMRVGFVVALALGALMAFIFFIGSERRIFARKATYEIQLESVTGLAQGNPVQLSGVTIGSVRDIWLPRDPASDLVEIEISVDRKFANRIRMDSRARVRKLGLIAADSYIDITPGSPDQPVLPPGSVIPSSKPTDVDALIASGEDLVDNFVQISYSLKNVLQRVDAGEGLIGELTTSPDNKVRVTDTVVRTLDRADQVLLQIQSGEGLAGKVIYDEEFGDELADSVQTAASALTGVANSVRSSFETGEGAIPALLNDPASRERVDTLLANLETASANLSAFSVTLSEGEGIVPRLLDDKAYGDDTLEQLNLLLTRLAETARMLQEGEGTAGRLIADPSAYEAINDILIGINESRVLRWLIRNRQEAGIEKRYDEALESMEETPPEQ